MARVASSPVSLHRLRPLHFHQHPSLHLQKPSFQHLRNDTRFPRIFCETNPNPSECCQTSPNPNPPESAKKEELSVEPGSNNGVANSEVSVSSNDAGFLEYPDKNFNRRIALFSVFGAVGLFLSRRLEFNVSLKDLSAAAITYEEALSNGKPTVVEFYADWCEVCKELAPDVYKVEQQYKGKVNFVMMNVDNTKWEQELDEFGVEGIPHFAFLDKDGNEEGNVVGRLPQRYLLENVGALARGEASVPYARAVGEYSSAEARRVHQVADPRSHG